MARNPVCDGLNENAPAVVSGIGNMWFLVGGAVWVDLGNGHTGGHTSLELAFEVPELPPSPLLTLCLMLAVRDVRPQLPAPATRPQLHQRGL